MRMYRICKKKKTHCNQILNYIFIFFLANVEFQYKITKDNEFIRQNMYRTK
jgi:hypothetical protein